MDGLIVLLLLIIIVVVIVISNSLQRKLNRFENKIDLIAKKITVKTVAVKQDEEQEQTIYEEPQYFNTQHTSTIVEPQDSFAFQAEKLSSQEEIPVVQETSPLAELVEEQKQTEPIEKSVDLAERQFKQKTVPKPKSLNYEKLIGANIFSKIGILVLILGIGYFIKYAIDNEWINETMRTVLSYFFGISLLGIAQKLRKNYRAFSSLLAGGTFAIFYLTTALSYHYYDLFSQTTAFAILVGTTISMIVLSMLYDRKELSIISVVGGFIAPFIVGNESGSVVVLLSYITLLNVSMFFIAMRKSWSELPLLCFAFTYCILMSVSQLSADSSPITIIVFSTLFYLIFLVSTLRIQTLDLSKNKKLLYGVIFGANNLLYLGVITSPISALDLDLRIHGLFPIFIAMVNVVALATIRKYATKESFDSLKLSMLGIIIISLTVAIPTQLNGTVTSIIWALEIVALLFLYIKTRIRLYNIAAFAMYILTIGRLLFYDPFLLDDVTLGYLISIAIVGASFFAAANVLRRHKEIFNLGPIKYNPFNPIFIFSGIITYAGMIILANQLVYDSQVILITGFIYLTLLIQILPYRFGVKTYANKYLIATTSFFIMNFVYSDASAFAYIIQFVCVALSLVKIATPFVKDGDYKIKSNKNRVIAFNVIIYLTCYQIAVLCLDSQSLNLSWIISIISVIIAFVQILVGMKVHFKLLRMIGICCFGFILAKLILIDLWTLSSGGKIATLILLGIILLTLSFLYQRVQNILFKDELFKDELSNKNESTDEK